MCFQFQKPPPKYINSVNFVIIFNQLCIGIILYLLYRFRAPIQDFTHDLLNHDKSIDVIPTSIAGLDITKESLPDDIVASASRLWKQQQYRDAMGLLYRATLSRLVHDYHCELFSSFTEQECFQATKKLQKKPLTLLMKKLTQHWLQLAYGHKLLDTEIFEQLCQQWQQTFALENHDAR